VRLQIAVGLGGCGLRREVHELRSQNSPCSPIAAATVFVGNRRKTGGTAVRRPALWFGEQLAQNRRLQKLNQRKLQIANAVGAS